MASHAGAGGGGRLGAHDMVVVLTLLVGSYYEEEEGLYYLESPHLDIVRAGKTREEARQVFEEAISLLLEGWEKRGTAVERLTELGFERKSLGGSEGLYVTAFYAPGVSDLPGSDSVGTEDRASRRYEAYEAAPYSLRDSLSTPA